MLIGYLTFDAGDRKRAERPLYFLILSTLLMLMTARWKRFAEYFPPFAILFAAFALAQSSRESSIESPSPPAKREKVPKADEGVPSGVLIGFAAMTKFLPL